MTSEVTWYLCAFLIIQARLKDYHEGPIYPAFEEINCLVFFIQTYIKLVYDFWPKTNALLFVFVCVFAGTRIIYERAFLMNLKNSPLSRTPPSNVPSTLIRGCKNVPMSKLNGNNSRYPSSISRSPPTHKSADDQQFDMDL